MNTNTPYHYDYTPLDNFLENGYAPQEVADRLREARLGLAELMNQAEASSDWKLLCYRALFELEEIFRHLPAVQA